MKKLFGALVCLTLCVALIGCGGGSPTSPSGKTGGTGPLGKTDPGKTEPKTDDKKDK